MRGFSLIRNVNKRGFATITLTSDTMRVVSRNTDRIFHYSWLRDQCQCPKCVDPDSKQKLHTSGSMVKTKKPKYVKIYDGTLVVEWGPPHGPSRYDLASLFLKYYTLQEVEMATGLSEWDYLKPTWVSFQDFMSQPQARAWALHTLHMSGLFFIRGVPTVPGTVATVAERLAPVMHTFYGRVWDVRDVANATNIAYTNRPLHWHQDLLYFESPPGLQLLHCLRPAHEGGETLFLDGANAAQHFEATHAQDYDLLRTVKLTYHYQNAGVSLQQSRPVFQPAMEPASLRKVYWSPPWQAPLNVRQNLVPRVYGALHAFERCLDRLPHLSTRLEEGEVVVFDNHRMLHARRQYSGGQRHLQGCYIARDAYRTALSEREVQKWTMRPGDYDGLSEAKD